MGSKGAPEDGEDDVRNPDWFEVFLVIFGPLGCSGRCCTCDEDQQTINFRDFKCSVRWMRRNGPKWALGDVSLSDSHQVSLARLAPMFAMLGDSLMIPDVGISWLFLVIGLESVIFFLLCGFFH